MAEIANNPDSQAGVDDGMPRGVRRAVWGAVAGVTVLAIYLLAVRGPALLVDLATGVANAFCF